LSSTQVWPCPSHWAVGTCQSLLGRELGPKYRRPTLPTLGDGSAGDRGGPEPGGGGEAARIATERTRGRLGQSPQVPGPQERSRGLGSDSIGGTQGHRGTLGWKPAHQVQWSVAQMSPQPGRGHLSPQWGRQADKSRLGSGDRLGTWCPGTCTPPEPQQASGPSQAPKRSRSWNSKTLFKD
jgi:hypothetical protein